MATRAADFPDEILVEIFTRLPARSVGKFRSLSKPWRKFLSSPQFIKSHLSRQKSRHKQQQNLILVPWTSPPSIRVVETINDDDSTVSKKLDFPAGIVRHPVITCDGLILLNISGMGIFLVNPITLEQVKIPNPPFEGEFPHGEGLGILTAYGLGHDSVNDDYKVVLVSYLLYYSESYDDGRSINVDVYSLDVYSMKMGVWKRIKSPLDRYTWTWPPPWPGPSTNGASVNGAMHWLTGQNFGYGLIAAFDFANEVCFEIPAPSDVNVESTYLWVLGGCLCLIDIRSNRTRTDVWIMKDYGVADSWTKFTFPRSGPDFSVVTPLCFIRDEKEVVSFKGEHLFVHNLKEGTTRNLVVDGVLGRFGNGYAFVGSLVSPIALCGREQASE